MKKGWIHFSWVTKKISDVFKFSTYITKPTLSKSLGFFSRGAEVSSFFPPSPVIQTKLTHKPNDEYNQEAGVIADKIMGVKKSQLSLNPPSITPVQRKCAHCEEEEKMQRKEINAEETDAENGLTDYVNNLGNSGHSLPNEIRNYYEPRFGYDFSKVKMHTDAAAAESAQSVNALAYTSGNNIVFNKGQYSPQTDNGKRLLGHELTHVVQQRNSNLLSPMIARATVSKDFPEKDGSVITVGRDTKPGKCVLVPKTQTKTSGDIGGKNAFIQFDFCKGNYGGKIRGQINYGDAINKANQAAKDFFNNVGGGQNPQRALQSLKQELNRIAPDAEVTFGFQAKDVRVNIGGTGEASGAAGLKGKGTVSTEVDIGPVTIGVQGEVTGGTQEKTGGQVLIIIKNADKGPAPADCHICNCSNPIITFWCNKIPAPGPKTPEPDKPKPVTIPLYFEYQKTEPRPGWEKSYQSMLVKIVELLELGYTINKIEGYTSPEGPLQTPKVGDFENKELSQKRATEAWNDIQTEIKAKFSQRYSTMRFKQLQDALNNTPSVIGLGELFGISGTKEVPNTKLFDYIKKLDANAKKEGKDIFAENNIAGENLPEQVSAENQKHIEEFRTGEQQGRRKKLSETERLESLYKTLRRALVFLSPPVETTDFRKIDLTPKPEKIIGESIDCSDSYKKLLNDAMPLGNDLLEGECNEQGKETKRFPK